MQLAAAILGLGFALHSAAPSNSDINANLNTFLKAWLTAQTQLHSWSADFTQTRRLPALTQPLVATGHVWFQTPDRFRWELGSPPQTIALREADQMFIIYPRLKRAERYPLGPQAPRQWRQTLALLDAGFPRRRADLEARFRVLSLTESNATWQLRLQPKSGVARRLVREIRVDLAANGFSLKSTQLIFADGSSMRNDFAHALRNRPLDPRLFRWQPPPGFKITEPFTP